MVQEAQLSLSSGELALAALKDIQRAQEPILFLDEWDANLSRENRLLIDDLIEKISQDKAVVEIRHDK